MSDEVLTWLSVCGELQMICIWSSWCPVISYFIKIQIGLTFLVSAYPSCPGKAAVKWVSVYLSVILQCTDFVHLWSTYELRAAVNAHSVCGCDRDLEIYWTNATASCINDASMHTFWRRFSRRTEFYYNFKGKINATVQVLFKEFYHRKWSRLSIDRLLWLQRITDFLY